MALGILGAYGGLNKKEIPDALFVGDSRSMAACAEFGALCPSRSEARRSKLQLLIVPEVTAREAAMVAGVEVYPVKSLLDVIHYSCDRSRKRLRERAWPSAGRERL
jgi:magnesium chelatase family protein